MSQLQASKLPDWSFHCCSVYNRQDTSQVASVSYEERDLHKLVSPAPSLLLTFFLYNGSLSVFFCAFAYCHLHQLFSPIIYQFSSQPSNISFCYYNYSMTLSTENFSSWRNKISVSIILYLIFAGLPDISDCKISVDDMLLFLFTGGAFCTFGLNPLFIFYIKIFQIFSSL